ncbi:hypothetical protein KC340_g14780 [Hortaea werneckii]|nr:hypothetical protein KC342_g17125 [Hortaea werneckii]KAI7064656.1 hypothetical protein KC339_g15975 [Hortaea werneckii]KAI7209036.1 hypothetical protein KC365_g15831 [Hortaea werneckii]KAI7297692.1 hypothetical protein KC340_g14780 [Hortaea werneckii]KAI7376688.1 hypothetical protein KC328_g14789 [Hortaea werneckii]
MEASPFARLSAELRNQIWTYALYQPDGFYLELQGGGYELSEKGHRIALIKTCRQINAEASMLLYNVNKFTFSAIMMESPVRLHFPKMQLVEDWLCTIGPAKASTIAEICFDLGFLPHIPWLDFYKEFIRRVFGLIPQALYAAPSPCKNLAALTAIVHLKIYLDNENQPKTLALEIPLIDEAEAIRRLEEMFEAEWNEIMRRLELGYEESDLEDPASFFAWALKAFRDDCARLNKWKNELLSAIKKA